MHFNEFVCAFLFSTLACNSNITNQACLSHYETRWAQLLASLDRRATSVREACGDSLEIQRAVETRVDSLVSRWSQLTEPQMDLDDNPENPLDSPNPRIYFPLQSPQPRQQQQSSVQVSEPSFYVLFVN